MFPEPKDAISYGNKLKFTKTNVQLLNRFVGFIHESRFIHEVYSPLFERRDIQKEISPNILQ